MLALRISINFTLGIMAGAMRLRQVLNLECGDLAPLCHSETYRKASNTSVGILNKAVAGHRTPKRSLTPSKRLFMIASHACQIGFYNY